MEECTSTAYARNAWRTFGVTQTLTKIRLGVRAPPHADAEAPRVPRLGTQSQIHADNQTFVILSAFPMALSIWRHKVWANRADPQATRLKNLRLHP